MLLPGLDGTGILFQPLVAALPDNIQPIVVSYPLDRRLTYGELLPLVMEALPGDGPFIILGESFSGPLAVMAAAEHPKGLAGIILCASFVSNPKPIVGRVIRVVGRSWIYRMIPPRVQLKMLVGEYLTPGLLALLAQVHGMVRPEVMAFRLRMSFGVDVRRELGRCEVPMLYIAGEKDSLVPRRNFRVIQGIQPGIQSVNIAAPHMVLQTRPMEAAEAISKHIRWVAFGSEARFD